MSHARLLPAVALLAIAHAIPAQKRVWIVDAAGGAGSHFRTLAAAFAVARDGEMLRVRAGSYAGATTNRAVAIVCAPGTTITSALEVRALPRGRDSGLSGAGFSSALRVRDCRGRVAIEDCRISTPNFGFASAIGIEVVNSAAVSIHRCTSLGAPGLVATGSLVTVTSSSLVGHAAYLNQFPWRPREGVLSRGSTVWLTDVIARGGSDTVTRGKTSPASAIVSTGDSIWLTGNGVVAAGSGGNGARIPGITATGSTLRVDPAVVVQGGNGGPPFFGSQPTRLPIPALRMQGAASPGALLRGALDSRAGDLFCVFHALPGDPISVPAFGGHVWLDLGRLVVPIHCGLQRAAGATWQLRLPSVPGIAGFTFTWQAASGTAVRGVSLSNAVLAVVR